MHGEYGGSNVVVAPAGSLERDSDSSGNGSGGARTGRMVELSESALGANTGLTGMTSGSQWTSGTETGWTDETVSRATLERGSRSIP